MKKSVLKVFMKTRSSINAKLTDSILDAFAVGRGLRGRVSVQDALEQAISLWLAAPYKSDKEPVDIPPSTGVVSESAVPYRGDKWIAEIRCLIEIMESGLSDYIAAIQASLLALKRGARLERSIGADGAKGTRSNRLLGEAAGMLDTPGGMAARREGIAASIAAREAEEKIPGKRNKTA